MDRPDGSGTTVPWTRNLRGPAGQLFGDPAPGPDETAFQVDNTSDEYYNSPYYKQHENDVEPVPMAPPGAPLAVDMHDPAARTLKLAFTAPGVPAAADAVTIELT